MPRKTRRKIKRRKRKNKPKKYKGFLAKHLNSPITTYWTKATTYILIVFESVFVIWWLQELLLNWEEIIMKLRNLIRIGG